MREDTKDKILNPLKEADTDLSIQEITDKAPYSRKTVEKYVHILEADEEIRKTRQVGNSKFYTVKE